MIRLSEGATMTAERLPDQRIDPPPPATPQGACTTVLAAIGRILDDRTLSAAQKVVLAAVAAQINAETGLAWTSYRQLAARCGVSCSTVQRAMAAAGGHLQAARTGPRGAIAYQVAPRPSQASAPARVALDETSAPTRVALDSGSAPARVALDAGSAPTRVALDVERTHQSSDTVKEEEETTHLPPADAGGVSLSPSAAKTAAPEAVTDTKIVEQIEQAYRTVFGTGLPWRWRRRIKREWAKGDRTVLGRVDADAIAAGRALAAKRQKTFGLGWVLLGLADRLAAERDSRQAARAREIAQRQAQTKARLKEAIATKREALQREYYEALTPEDQEAYRRAVLADRLTPAKKRPDLLNAFAAALAWRTHQAGEPA